MQPIASAVCKIAQYTYTVMKKNCKYTIQNIQNYI